MSEAKRCSGPFEQIGRASALSSRDQIPDNFTQKGPTSSVTATAAIALAAAYCSSAARPGSYTLAACTMRSRQSK
eukprot:3848901-Rhodomonas_salina.2